MSPLASDGSKPRTFAAEFLDTLLYGGYKPWERTLRNAPEGFEILVLFLKRMVVGLFHCGARSARKFNKFCRVPAKVTFRRARVRLQVQEPSIHKPSVGGIPGLTDAEYRMLAADDALDALDVTPQPELLMRSEDAPLGIDPSPEPRLFDILREQDGTLVLKYRDHPPEPARVKEGSRYRRKLIPPDIFNRRGPGVDRS